MNACTASLLVHFFLMPSSFRTYHVGLVSAFVVFIHVNYSWVQLSGMREQLVVCFFLTFVIFGTNYSGSNYNRVEDKIKWLLHTMPLDKTNEREKRKFKKRKKKVSETFQMQKCQTSRVKY